VEAALQMDESTRERGQKVALGQFLIESTSISLNY
jgi:hypothetical protein